MGKLSYQILAVLLLCLTATISLAGQEDPLMLAPAARHAGCHERGAKPPASVPVSYRCCQSGHNSVLLRTSLTTQLSSARPVSNRDLIPAPIEISTQTCLYSLTIFSPDPPHPPPLRV